MTDNNETESITVSIHDHGLRVGDEVFMNMPCKKIGFFKRILLWMTRRSVNEFTVEQVNGCDITIKRK